MIGRSAEEAERYPGNVEHPLVRTNPDTGRKAIYHNPNRVECILGIDRPESDALCLDELDRPRNPGPLSVPAQMAQRRFRHLGQSLLHASGQPGLRPRASDAFCTAS